MNHRYFAIILLILSLTGCTGFIYYPPISQGNEIDEQAIEQLSLGMSKTEVTHLLGTPVLNSYFSPQKWTYVYYTKNRRNDISEMKKLTVSFEQEKVSQIINKAS